MARIRTIKPEFFASMTIAKLPLAARLTFIGMWNYCDDAGRGHDETRLLKATIWPLDDEITPAVVGDHLDILAAFGLVVRYAGPDGARLFAVRNWKEHQRLDHPRESTLPPPPVRDDTGKQSGGRRERSRTNPAGKEGKGKEGKGRDAGRDDSRDGVCSWTTEAGELWRPRGEPPFARIGKALKPLVAARGARQVLMVWEGYLDERRDKSYATPEDFAQNYELHRKKWGQVIAADGCTWEAVPDEPEVAA